jgi:hypothetical protein
MLAVDSPSVWLPLVSIRPDGGARLAVCHREKC